jgi:hypothetical protein
MSVVNFMPLQENEHPYPSNRRLDGPQSHLGILEKKKLFSPYYNSNPKTNLAALPTVQEAG